MHVVYLVVFAVFNAGCVCWLNNQKQNNPWLIDDNWWNATRNEEGVVNAVVLAG